MKRGFFCIRTQLVLLTLPVVILLLAATAHAVVTELKVEGLRPDEPVSLTKDDDPKVTTEGRANKDGTVTFKLGQFNLPAGSSVRITPAGRESKVIPSLADGASTRDFRNPDQGASTGKAPGHGWNASGQVSYGRHQVGGQAVIGVFIGPDKSIVQSPTWVSGVSPTINFNGPVGPYDLQTGFKGYFGNGKNSETVPDGGPDVGITFDKTFAGSPGIGLGNTGASVNAKVDVNKFEFNMAVANLFYEFTKPGMNFKIGPRAVFGYNQTDYNAGFQSLTFPGISSTRGRDVKQFYGGPGLTLQKTHELTERVHFYAGINLDALYSATDLDARQHTMCNLCPDPLKNVGIKSSDRDSKWIFRPGATAGLEYEFNSSSLGFNVGYEFWLNSSVLRDRENPSQRPPGLKDQNLHQFQVGLFYEYKFGRR